MMYTAFQQSYLARGKQVLSHVLIASANDMTSAAVVGHNA